MATAGFYYILMAKKEGIRKLFDRIAGDYDRLNHILSLNIDKGWRKKAAREIADTNHPMHVLDVACGTGDFTIEIARHLGKGSSITGIDISEEMMKIGRQKLAQAGIAADMVQGDCEDLAYSDGTFDRISVGFGVRNFNNIEKGLMEMHRVLKPGGKLVILELSIPSNPVIRFFYKLYFLKILPAVGGWISRQRSAYEYLPASVIRFPSPARFMDMMRESRFSEIRDRSFTFGICRMYIGVKP